MRHGKEWIAVLDFGSQYTQLIARRVRELSVYSEIHPFNIKFDELMSSAPSGIILSGGPDSVYMKAAPLPDKRIFSSGIPILGICYGMQLSAFMLDGKVEAKRGREYGYAKVNINQRSELFGGLSDSEEVWMSHGDQVTGLPEGFRTIGSTRTVEIAAMENVEDRIYGIQFHPEVHHTPRGTKVLENFLYKICRVLGNWTMKSFIEDTISDIRTKAPDGNVILGLSGGVDSSVTALILHRAVGEKLYSIFINNGLLRKNEAEEVKRYFEKNVGLHLIYADYTDEFLTKLEGVIDPEEKRKIIGEVFIRCFEKEAAKIGNVRYLAQGTLYPDVIESVSVKGPSAVIKSHHNVGGLPEEMDLELIEPLRELFKDEVRRVGAELGLAEEILKRHPFPGPGLAVRILGEVTKQRADLLREADYIFIQELKNSDWYDRIWQAFCVLLPVSSVGVMGDERTYENAVVLRAVHSVDGMTADWTKLPHELLANIANKIVNEIKGINRVVYDVTSKPPGTIEWE